MKDLESNKSKVIILEADGMVDSTHGYGFLLQKRLLEYKINSKKVYLPEIADQLDTLPKKPMIISGGMTEVTADIEWINQSKDFIRKVIKVNRSKSQGKIPLFGICFGAQLIAESYSKGSVTYLDNPEIGLTQVKIEKQHQLFNEFPNEFSGYTFHYNQILPKEVFTILSAIKHMGHYFIQAFEIPDAACYGVQFHPEFQFQEFKTLMETYRKLILKLGLDYEEIINSLKDIKPTSKILQNFVLIK
jgi:GMP synthase-like glutamine amidotransferase